MSKYAPKPIVHGDLTKKVRQMFMQVLKRQSIVTKLCIHTTLAVTVSLLFCFAAFVVSDAVALRAARTEQLYALASVLGENTRSALEFDDPSAAALTLSSLAQQPTIDFAILYDCRGQVFANYPAVVPAAMEAIKSDVAVEYSVYYAANASGLFFDGVDALSQPSADPSNSSLSTETVGSGRLVLHANMSGLGSQVAQRASLVSVVFFGSLAIGVVVSWFFQSAIAAPIKDLVDASQYIADNQDYSIRVTKRADDEIGILADAFNSMVIRIQAAGKELQTINSQLEHRVKQRTAQLAKSNDDLQREMAEREILQSELVSASRQAGMAEVATGVLHNVGNVLNSVNVSANILVDKLRQSRVTSLKKASDVICQESDLATFLTKDARGKHFPALLNELASTLSDERDVELQELNSLVANIEHIKEIVTMQQTFARCRGATEPLQLGKLIENALNIANAGFSSQGIEIERRFKDVPEITTEKHKLLQILINLLSNAKHALDGSNQDTKRVILSLGSAEGSLFVSVRDNGIGIPAENLTKVFSHGFTTKQHGHGFGLHSSALTANELGGALSVHSDGQGQGATFTLRLPIRQIHVNARPTELSWRDVYSVTTDSAGCEVHT